MPTLLQEFLPMPSTDIDGSLIVILGKEEAELVYSLLKKQRQPNYDWHEDALYYPPPLTESEKQLAEKLARNLSLPEIV